MELHVKVHYEAFNMAMLWKLPVVLLLKTTVTQWERLLRRTANHTDIWKLGLGYEMPCGPVDGMNQLGC
jgi:pyruvate dehydrogenase E1 component alpha subunit